MARHVKSFWPFPMSMFVGWLLPDVDAEEDHGHYIGRHRCTCPPDPMGFDCPHTEHRERLAVAVIADQRRAGFAEWVLGQAAQ